MVFGAYDLDLYSKGRDSNVVVMYPERLIVHRDWNPHDDRYDADVALLITTEIIPVTRFITPICLQNERDIQKFYEGVIAGWGSNINTDQYQGYEPIPSQLKIPIHSQEYCFLDNSELAKLGSNRTFCGGSKTGSGPCNGKMNNESIIVFYFGSQKLLKY